MLTTYLLTLAALAVPILADDSGKEWVPALPDHPVTNAQFDASTLKRQTYRCLPPTPQYCSAVTCAPAGTTCCNAQRFCYAGNYCLENGGCCPNGMLCFKDGRPPIPSPPPGKPSPPSQAPPSPSAPSPSAASSVPSSPLTNPNPPTPSNPPPKPPTPSNPPVPSNPPPNPGPSAGPNPPTKASGMDGQRRRTVNLEDEIEWEASWETEISCDPSERGKRINTTGTGTWTITNEVAGVALSTWTDTDGGGGTDLGFTFKPGGEDSGVELEQTFGLKVPPPEPGPNGTYDGIATGCAITYKYAIKWTAGIQSQEMELAYTIPEIMRRAALFGVQINKIELFASLDDLNAAETATPPPSPSSPPGESESSKPTDTYTTKPNGKVCKVKPTPKARRRREF